MSHTDQAHYDTIYRAVERLEQVAEELDRKRRHIDVSWESSMVDFCAREINSAITALVRADAKHDAHLGAVGE